jgi:hypothetical protein
LIRKGIVVEVYPNYAIAMNEGGLYDRIAIKGNLFSGDSIVYTYEDILFQTKSKKKGYRSWMLSAAVFLLVLAITFMPDLMFRSQVYAVVSLDINPSIQYYLNVDGKVLRAEAMNEDGKTILDEKLEGLQIDEAIDRTLKNAEREEYLKPDSKILISATTLKSDDRHFAERLANEVFEDSFIVENKIDVVVMEASQSDFDGSKLEKTSLGKYKVYELNRDDSEATLTKIREMKASEIIENRMIREDDVIVFKNMRSNESKLNVLDHEDETENTFESLLTFPPEETGGKEMKLEENTKMAMKKHQKTHVKTITNEKNVVQSRLGKIEEEMTVAIYDENEDFAAQNESDPSLNAGKSSERIEKEFARKEIKGKAEVLSFPKFADAGDGKGRTEDDKKQGNDKDARKEKDKLKESVVVASGKAKPEESQNRAEKQSEDDKKQGNVKDARKEKDKLKESNEREEKEKSKKFPK